MIYKVARVCHAGLGTEPETNIARETRRAPLVLSDAYRRMLTELSGSRTTPAREVERATLWLRYVEGISISEIQRQGGVSRPTIYKCIEKRFRPGFRWGIAEFNEAPVPFRWKKFNLGLA